MASDGEISCTNDPNFAVIYSFLKVFGKLYGLDVPSIAKLQQLLEDTDEVSEPLKELHLRLLRRALKSVQSGRWERCLVKFCHQRGHHQEAWEIERFSYKKASTEVKLKTLKILLEYQFTCHAKFKAAVNALTCKDLRLDPLGRDKNGCVYWLQVDDEANLCLYKEDQDEETWHLIARNREELVKVIGQLKNGEEICPSTLSNNNEDSSSPEIATTTEKTNTQAEEENEEFLSPESESDHEDEESKADKKPNHLISESHNTQEEKTNINDEIPTDEGQKVNENENVETATIVEEKIETVDQSKPLEKISENDVNSEPQQSNELVKTEDKGVDEVKEEIVKEEKEKNLEPEEFELTEKTESKESVELSKENNSNEVSEAIEEPIMVVTGEGSGADCESFYFIGEEISEPVMYIYGEGYGYDNDTGNPEVLEETNNEQKKTDAENGNEECVNGEHSINDISNSSIGKMAKSVKLKSDLPTVTKRLLKKQSNDSSEVLKSDSKKHCVRKPSRSNSLRSNSSSNDNDLKREGTANDKTTDSEITKKNYVKKGRGKTRRRPDLARKLKLNETKESSPASDEDCQNNKASIIEKRKNSVSSDLDAVENTENEKEGSPDKETKVEDDLPSKKIRLESTAKKIEVSHSKETDTIDNIGKEGAKSENNENNDNLNTEHEDKDPIAMRKKIKANKGKFKRKKVLQNKVENSKLDNGNNKVEEKEKNKSKPLKRSLLDATNSDKNKSESQSESEDDMPITSGKRLKIKPKKIITSSRKKVEEAKLLQKKSSDDSEEETLHSIAGKKTVKRVLKKKPKGKEKPGSQQEESDLTPVRQSRRIAQQKIKEEADRRHLEEVALRELKLIHKKKSKDDDEEEWRASGSSSGSPVRAPRRAAWRAADSTAGSESDSDDLSDRPQEPDLVFDQSDHEFSPESDLETGEPSEPLKRARTLQEGADDGFCKRCGSGEQPEWILLCDKCDAGYHASCLKPMLFLVPEGDWFCPSCNHEMLISSLESELVKYDELLVTVEEKRAKREELERQQEKPPPTENSEQKEDEGSGSGSSSEESSGSSAGAVYRLRARRQLPVSYRAQEYDRLISSAIKVSPAGDHLMGSAEGSGSGSSSEESSGSSAGAVYRLRARRQLPVSYRAQEYDRLISSAIKVSPAGDHLMGSAEGSGSGSSSEESSGSSAGAVYRLRARRQLPVSYRAQEYDRLISSAIKVSPAGDHLMGSAEGSGSGSSSEESSGSSAGAVYRLRARRQLPVSYRAQEYDRLISSAIKVSPAGDHLMGSAEGSGSGSSSEESSGSSAGAVYRLRARRQLPVSYRAQEYDRLISSAIKVSPAGDHLMGSAEGSGSGSSSEESSGSSAGAVYRLRARRQLPVSYRAQEYDRLISSAIKVSPAGDHLMGSAEGSGSGSSSEESSGSSAGAVYRLRARRQLPVSYRAQEYDRLISSAIKVSPAGDHLMGSAEGSGSGSSSEESSGSSAGAVYRLRARRQLPVSYRAQEYDRLISSAIKEEYVEPTTSAGNQGRGKDISTIIEAAEEEKLKAEREEAIAQGKPIEVRKKKKQRRKPRKLNSLEVVSEDDDETDEDFKDTGMESSSEEISSSAERDSTDSRSSDSLPIRRPCRTERKDRPKLRESSPEEKKKKGEFAGTSSESSGAKEWPHKVKAKSKSRSKRDKSYIKKKKKRKEKRGLTQYDAAGNVIRARVTYGGLSDDSPNDWSPKHRTRQKKINYTEMPNTESEDEMHKGSGKHMPDSSDEFKVEESEATSDSDAERAKRARADDQQRALSDLIKTAVVPLEKLPDDVTRAKEEELQAHLNAQAALNARGRGRGRGGRGSRGGRSGRGARAGSAPDDALSKLVGVKIKDLGQEPMKPNQLEREKKRQEREAKLAEKEAKRVERIQKKEEKDKLKEQKAKEREEKRLARLALQESKRMKKEKPEYPMAAPGAYGARPAAPYPDYPDQRLPATPRLQVRAELRGVPVAGPMAADQSLREGTLSVAGSPQPFKPASEEPSVITRMPHMLNHYRGPMMYSGGGPAGYGPRQGMMYVPHPGLPARPQYPPYYGLRALPPYPRDAPPPRLHPPGSSHGLPLPPHGPPGSSHGPPGPMHGPPGSSHGPPGSSHGPPGSSHGPPGSSHGPPGSSHGPPGSSHGPPGSSHGPPGPLRGPQGPLHGLPGSSHGPPGSSHGPPVSSHGPPGPMHGPPGSSHGQPGSSHGPPGAMHGPPGSSHGPPASSHGPPGSSHGPPGSLHGSPGPSHGPPRSMHGPPGSSHGPPGPAHGPPGSLHGPPGSAHGPPGSAHGPPGSSHGPPGPSHGPSGPLHGPPGPLHGPPGSSHGLPGTMHGLPGSMHGPPRSSHGLPGSPHGPPGPHGPSSLHGLLRAGPPVQLHGLRGPMRPPGSPGMPATRAPGSASPAGPPDPRAATTPPVPAPGAPHKDAPIKIKTEVKTEPEYHSPVQSPPRCSPEPPRHPKIKHTENKERRPRYPLGPYAPQYGPYGPYAPPGPSGPEAPPGLLGLHARPPGAGPSPLQRMHLNLQQFLPAADKPEPARSPLRPEAPPYLPAQQHLRPHFAPPGRAAYEPAPAAARSPAAPSDAPAPGPAPPEPAPEREPPAPLAIVKTEPRSGEEGGVFGGLVSYFSSQHEDDELDA